MPTLKSPGQKTKGIVRSLSFIVFFVIATGVYLEKSSSTISSIEWANHYAETTAMVNSVDQHKKMYTTSSTAKHYRQIYEVTYRFELNGISYVNTKTIYKALYTQLNESIKHYGATSLIIYYERNNPQNNDLKSTATKQIVNNNNNVRNIFVALSFAAIGTYILYHLLTLFLRNKSKKVLFKGFYTENTWLDVDDNFLVALDAGDLIFFDIHKKQSGKVQTLYQSNASPEEIIATSQYSKFYRVAISEISKLNSAHNSDIITINHNGQPHRVQFLNPALKKHALQRIQPLLSDSLVYNKTEVAPFKRTLPAIILTLILSVTVIFTRSEITTLIALAILVAIIPVIISALLDPGVIEEWRQPTPGA